jgi:hypothetical protein
VKDISGLSFIGNTSEKLQILDMNGISEVKKETSFSTFWISSLIKLLNPFSRGVKKLLPTGKTYFRRLEKEKTGYPDCGPSCRKTT